VISPSYFTFLQVAEKWSHELRQPTMEVIQAMRSDATYLHPHPQSCPKPALMVWPEEFVHPHGHTDSMKAFEACRMVEKDSRNGIGVHKKFRTQYRTPEYLAALAFLNSAKSPPELTDELKEQLACLIIRREDFEKYCNEKGYSLPKFWFPQVPQGDEILSDEQAEPNDEILSDKQAISKGGRPKSLLSEAVSYAYLKFRDEGNTEILRPNKIREFLARFKEMIQEVNRNFDVYIAERIQKVKLTPSGCIITTQDQYLKSGVKRESRSYHKAAVSKLLTDLRKKYPFSS